MGVNVIAGAVTVARSVSVGVTVTTTGVGGTVGGELVGVAGSPLGLKLQANTDRKRMVIAKVFLIVSLS